MNATAETTIDAADEICGPVRFPSNFAVTISGTWVGTLSLMYKEPGGSFRTFTTFTANPALPQEVFFIADEVEWQVKATAWTSGAASVRLLGESI